MRVCFVGGGNDPCLDCLHGFCPCEDTPSNMQMVVWQPDAEVVSNEEASDPIQDVPVFSRKDWQDNDKLRRKGTVDGK